MPGLRDLRQRVDAPTIPLHLDQVGWRWQIAVPDIVPHDLMVPEAPARGGVERDNGVAEEVLTLSVAAPVVIGR